MISLEGQTIGIRVVAAAGHSFVPDFLDAANNFLRLASEVDLAVSGEFVHTVDWALRQLSLTSPASLVMEPIVREGQEDNRNAIIESMLQGVDDLKESDSRPRYFSDQALQSARRLASVLGERVDGVQIFSASQSVDCTEVIATHVRAILRPGREMLGSVEGRLEAMNSHDVFLFGIYEPVLGIRIECRLVDDASPDLRDKIISMYEMPVRASGILRANVKGEVRSAKIESIEALRSEQRFRKASEVTALYDITGGRDAADYVRSMRDA